MVFSFETGSGWSQIYYAEDFGPSCNMLKHDTNWKLNDFYIRRRKMNEYKLMPGSSETHNLIPILWKAGAAQLSFN